MNQLETTTRFDFALEFPQHWQECLQKIKKEGFIAVTSHLFWGLHESTRGMRDFSKSSKLKVEKFLQLAHSVGLKVDLVFGFMPSRYTFPDWIKSLPGQKALVPAMEWDGISGPYFQNEVPSLENNHVADSFLSFVEEAITFIPLYIDPEGPVRNVFFDAGIYHYNQSITDDGSFSRWLKQRYGEVAVLNSKYQTSFNSFSNAGSKTGFRVLLDKRPWLAAYDYKSARHDYLSSFNARVTQLSNQIEIKISSAQVDSLSKKWNFTFDSVFVEGRESLFPFSPEALALPQSVVGFRFLQSIQNAMTEWGFFPMPLWAGDTSANHANAVVINGKYLSHAGLNWVRTSLQSGAQLLFPFGIPQFDEEMKLSRLTNHTQRETQLITSNQRLMVYTLGPGKMYVPEPHLAYDAGFQNQVENIVANIQQSGVI